MSDVHKDQELLSDEIRQYGWEVKRKLGHGSTGAVFHATRTSPSADSQPVERVEQAAIKAFKMVSDEAPDGRPVFNEIVRQMCVPENALVSFTVCDRRKLYHPHIIQLRYLIRTRSFLCLVMEYANAGDLFKVAKYSKGLPESAARFLFQQLVLLLDFCHDPKINMYIRDVKPSNLLLLWSSSGMPLVKLTDFNLAKDVSLQGPVKTPMGCTMWMSPQAVRNRSRNYEDMTSWGPLCDVWSAAVTLYYLLYAKWPFNDKTILQWTVEGAAVNTDAVEYKASNDHGPISQEAINIMKKVFDCGNLHTVEEWHSRGVSIQYIKNLEWFSQDLPADALNLKAECLVNTARRLESEAYQQLLRDLKDVANRTQTPLSIPVDISGASESEA